MKFLGAVFLPFCIHLLLAIAVIFSNNGNGSFIGLGVLVIGVWLIPLTAIINWIYILRKPPLATRKLVKLVLFTSLVFPALVLPLSLIPT